MATLHTVSIKRELGFQSVMLPRQRSRIVHIAWGGESRSSEIDLHVLSPSIPDDWVSEYPVPGSVHTGIPRLLFIVALGSEKISIPDQFVPVGTFLYPNTNTTYLLFEVDDYRG
jgi:hypothetical protein